MTTEFHFWVNHQFNQQSYCLIVRYSCISCCPCIVVSLSSRTWVNGVWQLQKVLNKHLTDPLISFAFFSTWSCDLKVEDVLSDNFKQAAEKKKRLKRHKLLTCSSHPGVWWGSEHYRWTSWNGQRHCPTPWCPTAGYRSDSSEASPTAPFSPPHCNPSNPCQSD